MRVRGPPGGRVLYRDSWNEQLPLRYLLTAGFFALLGPSRGISYTYNEEGDRLRQPVLEAVERTLGKATHGVSEKQLTTAREFLRGFLANMQEERRGSDE